MDNCSFFAGLYFLFGTLFLHLLSNGHDPRRSFRITPARATAKRGRATIKARVISDLSSRLNAKAKGGARAKVRGRNPFKNFLKKIKRRVTRVKLTSINSDGARATMTVKVIAK